MIRRAFAQSCCSTPAAMCFWATTFMLLYGIGLLAGATWPWLQAFSNTYLLVALGSACLINFGRNRTLHCGITGPLLVGCAIAMSLIEAQTWRVDPNFLWGFALVSVGAALLFESRTTSSGGDSANC